VPGRGDMESPAMGLGCHALNQFSVHSAPIMVATVVSRQR
jgi:hypothetical protein